MRWKSDSPSGKASCPTAFDFLLPPGVELVDGLASGVWAYFLHSYRVAESASTVASCDYGGRFAAIVARDNVMATQFHPEKSRAAGARLLDNFVRIALRARTDAAPA